MQLIDLYFNKDQEDDQMHVHNAIYNTLHSGNFSYEMSRGIGDYLFLYFKTPTLLHVSEKTYTIYEPSVIIFSPYTPFRYLSISERYYDDYIHFAPDEEDDFLNKLHFPLNVPVKVSNNKSISSITKEICEEWQHSTTYLLEIHFHLMKLLMYRIDESWIDYNVSNSDVLYYEQLKNVQEKIHQNPQKNWRIIDLASEVMISPAYFQVLYKKAFGITCLTDVINTKLTAAKEYLLSTDMSIAAIAEELGYNEVYHFIRQFKKYIGLTPGAFRKKMRQ